MVKLRKYFGPLIVLAGTALAIQLMAVEANALERGLIEQVVGIGTHHSEDDVKFKKLRPASLGLNDIETFDEIPARLETQGYQMTQESWSLVCLAPVDFACNHEGSGRMMYKRIGELHNGLAVTYKYKLTLEGCQPAVNQVFQIDISEAANNE